MDLLKSAAQLFCMARPRTARDRVMNRRRPPTFHSSPFPHSRAPPFLEERAGRGFLSALPFFSRGVCRNRYVYSASWYYRSFFFFDVEIFFDSWPSYIFVALGYSSFSALSVGALQSCRASGRRWRRRRRRRRFLPCLNLLCIGSTYHTP